MDSNNLFKALEEHFGGVLVLILLLFVLIAALQWLAMIFRWGKYRNPRQGQESNLAYIVVNFFITLITQFRHLLALLIVFIFVGLIFYAMSSGDGFDEKMDSLQTVNGALGSLVSLIVGYYFGESASAARSRIGSGQPDDESGDEDNPIEAIAPPPEAIGGGEAEREPTSDEKDV